MPITRAVLPVAGRGTRFLPVTKGVPKELLPVVDRPCLDYIVAEAVEAGIGDIILVTAAGKEAIASYFSPDRELEQHLEAAGKDGLLKEVQRAAQLANVVTVQQHEALGLGHAVLTARSCVEDGESFAVLLGDDIMVSERPAIGQLVDLYDEVGQLTPNPCTVSLMEVPPEKTDRYGICSGEIQGKTMRISGMVEKPAPADAPSNQAIVGRYVLPYDIFDILEKTPKGRGGEIQLTDALAVLAAEGRAWGWITDGVRYDTGNPLGLIRATLHFALQRPELAPGLREIIAELPPE